MNIEEIRTYCLSKPSVTEDFPFDDTTLVFKVLGKMFALTGLNRQPPAINLKCDPEKAIELREEYDGIIFAGFHMNKKHWNTVEITNLAQKFVIELIDHSYDMVVKGMSKKLRDQLI
ncbi:MAG: MmcQ/YjbR family DNA-binding protein [Flavobacteriaceae bacterium]|nr:MmcQ/YjbR family DNA-binding protein [Flavobacteriaceae bacterium]